jgi:glycosyltransferase involved in cell wall biosynthesis
MRAGLPVVASGAGGAAEAVVEDVTGYIVRCGDVGAMARGLEKLIANAALRERLGAAGRRRYEERFTFERMYQNTLAVYRAALASEARVGLEPAAANTFRRTL